jgi:Kef-type K+ transport system membrane component KefB
MEETARILIPLGILLIIGLATDLIGRRTRLPRVTLLLIFGFAIGPEGLGYLLPLESVWLPVVANMALVMIGFLLGEKLTLPALRQHGAYVLWISVSEVVATACAVFAGLVVIGVPREVALLFAGIATATDPAAVSDVVAETRADGTFTETLLGIVAVDDAWGLIAFSLLFAAAQVLGGHGDAWDPILKGAWEIGGAFIVGIVLGLPMAYMTGRIRPGEPTLVEALGIVFLCGGIAMWLNVSFLLSSMVLGCVVANVARHHTHPFHAIEGIEWPFMIIFFILAGATLQIHMLLNIGLAGAGYVIFRIAGRIVGGWAGSVMSRAGSEFCRWMGIALLPQAGVALGMALVAIEHRPDLTDVLIPVVITSTVLFEVIGPVCTRLSLTRAGNVHRE